MKNNLKILAKIFGKQSFASVSLHHQITLKAKKMKITGNTIKAKISNINGATVKRVANDGGNRFTVYLNDVADNFKVAYAVNRAGWKRTANNGTSISIEV